MPSWRRCGSWPTGLRKKVGRGAGVDRVDGTRGPPAPGPPAVGPVAGGRRRLELVGLASGELFFHIFSALAQFERRLIQERTKAGPAAARARGRKGGRKPLSSADPR